jgi:Na+-translocating ferredoxin:NAD+ oxidoreductase RnfG subunit
MIQILIFIAIIAAAVLIYFNNSVKNRRIDRSNRLAEKQEALIQMLKEKNTQEDNSKKDRIIPFAYGNFV